MQILGMTVSKMMMKTNKIPYMTRSQKLRMKTMEILKRMSRRRTRWIVIMKMTKKNRMHGIEKKMEGKKKRRKK